jgi:PIN domain nuclease of toxin-antitoxin system
VNYLLDTAPFLWAVNEPDRLSRKAHSIITDRKHGLLVSVASLWEVVIKAQKGLLPLANPTRWLEAGIASIEAEILPIQAAHAYGVHILPPVHRDPFDRLLVAQAVTENLTLVSNDSVIREYPVKTIW